MAKSIQGHDGRGDVYKYKPENLILVTDETHADYDERVKWPVSNALVKSILEYGVIQPIEGRRDGIDEETKEDNIVVVVGRQRVKAAREANRILREKGEDRTILVPVMIRNREDGESARVAIAENELRTNDPVSVKARKMAKMETDGCDIKRIAAAFGCSMPTVRDHLDLMPLIPEILKEVDSGLPIKTALTLTDLPRAEQLAALKKLQDEGKTRKGEGSEAAAKEITGDRSGKRRIKRDVARNKKELSGVIETLSTVEVKGKAAETLAIVKIALEFAAGEPEKWLLGRLADLGIPLPTLLVDSKSTVKKGKKGKKGKMKQTSIPGTDADEADEADEKKSKPTSKGGKKAK